MNVLNDRFWNKVEKTENCWNWTGSKTKGYGKLGRNGKTVYAHRAVYEDIHGPISEGMHVCHTCDNPACVNPDHLWLGTPEDNIRDMHEKGRWELKNPRYFRGDEHPGAKLTERDVIQIREARMTGVTCAMLADRFNVGSETIRLISTGQAWSHVGGPLTRRAS